jgi:hypothetical protein
MGMPATMGVFMIVMMVVVITLLMFVIVAHLNTLLL